MHTYSLLEKLLFWPAVLDEKRLARSLAGKTILITGASSGIGEQLAYLLGRCEVQLLLVARREEKLRQLKREIEQHGTAAVSVFGADLREPLELESFLAWACEQADTINIVVSNAGLSIRRSIMDSLDRHHDFTRTMAINYFAPVRLLLSLLPQLARSNGQIIHISTINTSLVPLPYWAAYQASKAAFDTWFRSAAPEWNARGIATTAIYFPLVKTPMIAPTAAYRSMPAMSAEHAARVIAKSMCTRRKSWRPWWLLFGELASVLGRGLLERLTPRWLRKKGG